MGTWVTWVGPGYRPGCTQEGGEGSAPGDGQVGAVSGRARAPGMQVAPGSAQGHAADSSRRLRKERRPASGLRGDFLPPGPQTSPRVWLELCGIVLLQPRDAGLAIRRLKVTETPLAPGWAPASWDPGPRGDREKGRHKSEGGRPSAPPGSESGFEGISLFSPDASGGFQGTCYA